MPNQATPQEAPKGFSKWFGRIIGGGLLIVACSLAAWHFIGDGSNTTDSQSSGNTFPKTDQTPAPATQPTPAMPTKPD
jgi:hypothetical protein